MKFLLERVPVRSYIQHLGDGADWVKHLLLMAARQPSLSEVVVTLLNNFQQLLDYEPTQDEGSFKTLYKTLEFSIEGVLG